MGLFSAIGSFFSGVASAISSVCSNIGLGAMGTALTAAITALNPIIGLIIAAIPLVTAIIKMLGVKEVESEDIESGKLGVMAEDCRGSVKPESYETTSAYIKAVKENCDMERVNERMKNLSPEEKITYQLVSVGLAGSLVAEKLGADDDVDPAFLGKVNAAGLDAEKTVSLIKGLKDSGIGTADVSKYFEGNLNAANMDRVDAGLKSALGITDPSLKTEAGKEAAVQDMSSKIEAAIEAGKQGDLQA